MRGGQACHHGQGRKQRQQREHGLDALAGGHDAGRLAEAHRVAEEMAHGAARIVNRGLAAAVAGEPGALQAGERAVEVGDSAEKRGPALERRASHPRGNSRRDESAKQGQSRLAVMPRPRR